MSKTLRFAFGTATNPSTAVWRIIIESKGDVYLNVAPQMGNSVHISLHSSGKSHFKLADKRENLLPPFKVGNDQYLGLVIVYNNFYRSRTPTYPTGKINQIIWLGEPEVFSCFMVKLIYANENTHINAGNNEVILFEPYPVRFQSKAYKLWVILEKRELTNQEVAQNINAPSELLDFKKPFPTDSHIELFRLSKQNQINFVIHEKYRIKEY